jgi:hypothetical protein
MPLYFMHLRRGSDELLDPDGVELPVEAVRDAALSAARDCIAADVYGGRVDLRYRIDVHDEHGQLVHTTTFVDAIEIVAD